MYITDDNIEFKLEEIKSFWPICVKLSYPTGWKGPIYYWDNYSNYSNKWTLASLISYQTDVSTDDNVKRLTCMTEKYPLWYDLTVGPTSSTLIFFFTMHLLWHSGSCFPSRATFKMCWALLLPDTNLGHTKRVNDFTNQIILFPCHNSTSLSVWHILVVLSGNFFQTQIKMWLLKTWKSSWNTWWLTQSSSKSQSVFLSVYSSPILLFRLVLGNTKSSSLCEMKLLNYLQMWLQKKLLHKATPVFQKLFPTLSGKGGTRLESVAVVLMGRWHHGQATDLS